MFDKISKVIWLIASLLIIVIFINHMSQDNKDIEEEHQHSNSQSYDFNNCNVWVVKLYWDLLSYIPYSDTDNNWYNLYDEVSSEQIIDWIQYFANQDKYKMIILEVDSPWWSPYAAREIMNQLKDTNKETVALIRETWDSAWYWATLWANKIVASELSELWGIWIILSILNEEEYNKINWYAYEDLVTWKFKNAWSSNKKLTSEEKELFMRDINIMYNIFMSDIANERWLDLEKVKELSDWSTVLWAQWLKEWLIDELWDLNTIKEYFEKKYWEEAILCEY